MKHTISLVIGTALSFLMMFSSVAIADQMTVATSKIPSEVTKSEVVKVTPKATTQASASQPKASDFLDKGKLGKLNQKGCAVHCPGGYRGYMSFGLCVPCET
ncbi:MAG: hypothetical protein ACR9NN_03520 [Nostochopsis sp.]